MKTKRELKKFQISFLDYDLVSSAVANSLGINLDTVKFTYCGEEHIGFWSVLSEYIDGNGSVVNIESIAYDEACDTLKKLLDEFYEYGDEYYVSW